MQELTFSDKDITYKDLGDDPLSTISKEAHRFNLSLGSNKRTPQEQQALIKQGKTKATNSYHLYGDAVDITGDRVNMQKFYQHMKSTYGSNLAELIHNDTDHADHVHVAWNSRTSKPQQQEGEITFSNDDISTPSSVPNVDINKANQHLISGILALNPLTAGINPDVIKGMSDTNSKPRGSTLIKKQPPREPFKPSEYENQLAQQFEQYKQQGNIEAANNIGLELQQKGWEFGSTRDDNNKEWPYIKAPIYKPSRVLGKYESSQPYKGTDYNIAQQETEREQQLRQEEFNRNDNRGVIRKFTEGLGAGISETVDTMGAGALRLGSDIASIPGKIDNAFWNATTSQEYRDKLARNEKPTIKPLDQNILERGTTYLQKRAANAQEEQQLKGSTLVSKAGHTIGGLAPLFIPGGGQVAFGVESGLVSYGAGEPLDKAILTGLMSVKGAEAAGLLSKTLEREVVPVVARELASLAKQPSLAGKMGAATRNVIESVKNVPTKLEPYAARTMGQVIGLPLMQAGTGQGVPITKEDIAHTILMAMGFGISGHNKPSDVSENGENGRVRLNKKGSSDVKIEPKSTEDQTKAIEFITKFADPSEGNDPEVVQEMIRTLKTSGALPEGFKLEQPIVEQPTIIEPTVKSKKEEITFKPEDITKEPTSLEQIPAPIEHQPSKEAWENLGKEQSVDIESSNIEHENPIALAQPAEPLGTTEKPQVSTKQEFAKSLVEKWKYQPLWATVSSELAEARANTWANDTGKPKEEWYHTRLSTVGDYQDFVKLMGDPMEIAKAQGYSGDIIPRAVSTVQDGKGLIFALQQPNKTSAVHELAHIFRRMDLEGEHLKTAEDWLGVKDGNWTVEHEEGFARGFEAYLASGEAPTPQLKKVFDYFKNWIVNIYKAVTKVPKGGNPLEIKISPEVKGMFDSLLGKESTKENAKETTKEFPSTSDGILTIEPSPSGDGYRVKNNENGLFTVKYKSLEQAQERLKVEQGGGEGATLEYGQNGPVSFQTSEGSEGMAEGEKPPTAGDSEPPEPITDTVSKPPEGMKERSLPKTLATHGLPEGENLYYKEAPNNETVEKANNIITEKGIDGATEWLSSSDILNAEHTATGLILIDQLQQKGQTAKAIDLASTLSEKLTRYGQAVQAVRVLDKFSPARQLVITSKIYDKYHPGETMPVETANTITTEATNIRKNIDTIHKVSIVLDKVEDPFIKDNLIEGLQKIIKDTAKSKVKLAKTIENMSPWKRLQRKLSKLNILRAIEASVDLSAPGRQGMIFSVTHPLLSGKAFYKQLQALSKNPEAYKEFESTNLYNDPMYDFSRQAGVDYTTASASGMHDLSKAEEEFMTGLFEDWAASDSSIKRTLAAPVIRSEQAYVTFLNHQRLSVFKLYNKALLKAGIPMYSRVEFQAIDRATGEIVEKTKTRGDLAKYEDNPAYQIKDASVISKDYQYMADFINKATGRGNLGKGRIAGAVPFLNSILFSPKYVASRFQLIAEPIKLLTPKTHLKIGGKEIPHPTLKISGKLRYLVAKDLTIFAGAVAGSLYLVNNLKKMGVDAEVSTNPEDPDFLKARIGSAHYDLTGGFQGNLRMLFQLFNYFEDKPNLVKQGAYLREKGTGEYRKTGRDIAYEFLERKLAPIPGFITGAISGKSKDYDKLGKRLDFERTPELPLVGKIETFKGTPLERPSNYWNEFSKLFAPITIRDFYQAYEDEGVGGIIKSSPGILGVGTQIYKKKK